MAFKLAEAFVELSAKGFTKVEAGIAGIKKGLRELASSSGLASALSLTGLTVGIFKSIAAAEEAEKAQRRLAATIKLTGQESGVTVESINALAQSLAATSEFDDDSIARASATMLEFGNISKSTFEKAIPIAVDLAARNGDLEGSFRAVGAALADPVEGIGLLRRQFRALSPEVLKAAEELAKSGDIIGAQNLLIKELTSKTAGLAGAMKTPLDDAKKALSEMAEAVGQAMGPVVTWFAKGTKQVADFYAELARGSAASKTLSGGGVGPGGEMLKGSTADIDRAEREAAAARAKRGAERVGPGEGAIAQQKEEADAVNERYKAEQRASHEKERQQILEKLTLESLDKETAARETLVKQLDEQLTKLKELLATDEELAQADEMRAKALQKFDTAQRADVMEQAFKDTKQQLESQDDIFRSLLTGGASDKQRQRIEVDLKASDLAKQIREAFPEGDVRDSLIEFTEEMRAIQQEEINQAGRKGPEFVGLTEMASRIQQAVGSDKQDELDKRRNEYLKKLQDKAEGAGLNVNIKNISELEGLGAVGA